MTAHRGACLTNNRPYLRCLHGYGLCLWRLARHAEALRTFESICWLNPPDNQGGRSLIEDLEAGREWVDDDALP